jgi:hypothetical protein
VTLLTLITKWQTEIKNREKLPGEIKIILLEIVSSHDEEFFSPQRRLCKKNLKKVPNP